jgi:hypothetical protein
MSPKGQPGRPPIESSWYTNGEVFMRILALLLALPAFAGTAVTVVYESKVTTVTAALPDPDLWLSLPDLTLASGFVLKPQGACLDEVCVPIPKVRETAFLRNVEGARWFNLSELARTLHQPSVHDAANAIWLFGMRTEAQMTLVNTLQAPDFRLTDWKGTERSLSDFRGKKVLLITWASW